MKDLIDEYVSIISERTGIRESRLKDWANKHNIDLTDIDVYTQLCNPVNLVRVLNCVISYDIPFIPPSYKV